MRCSWAPGSSVSATRRASPDWPNPVSPDPSAVSLAIRCARTEPYPLPGGAGSVAAAIGHLTLRCGLALPPADARSRGLCSLRVRPLRPRGGARWRHPRVPWHSAGRPLMLAGLRPEPQQPRVPRGWRPRVTRKASACRVRQALLPACRLPRHAAARRRRGARLLRPRPGTGAQFDPRGFSRPDRCHAGL